MESGKFEQEIVAVTGAATPGRPCPLRQRRRPAGRHFGGCLGPTAPHYERRHCNSRERQQQNDAASVCLVVAGDKLEELGLKPKGFLRGWAVTGCHPAYMGIGPVSAAAKVMGKIGMSLEDMDLIELNEAFAAQVLAVLREWKLSNQDKLNVNGSGISLGHPIAATGARILTTLLHEMERRDVQFGLETMCVGGGQGVAAVFERR